METIVSLTGRAQGRDSLRVTYQSYGARLEVALGELIAEQRRRGGLTLEYLGELSGAHRTSIGLIERAERGLTIGMAAQLAKALRVDLSELVRRAEAALDERKSRAAVAGAFRAEADLKRLTGLTHAQLRAGIQSCYETLDAIDEQLARRGKPRMAALVELANLSGMVGNLLGAGIAESSGGRYRRNKPHTYPDLLGVAPHKRDLELKTALETNRPKGHLAKSGCHITFRYVLCGPDGSFRRGKEARGEVVTVWEVRVGDLDEHLDFDISNTAGDSGKTAVIKTESLRRMTVVYFDESALPYANVAKYRSDSGL